MTRKLIRSNDQPKSGPHQAASVQEAPVPIDEVKPLPSGSIGQLSKGAPPPRLHFLSNLRVFLTVLVVVHHTALPYGGLGSWDFQSRCLKSVSPLLAIFNVMNQTFFMALFMWMAGFFTHRELSKLEEMERRMRNVTVWERFGVRVGFVVGRARRLLLPTVFYTLVIAPIIAVMVKLRLQNQRFSEQGNSPATAIANILVEYFTSLRGIRGPVWFPALVFIFDAIATVITPFLPTLTSRYPNLAAKLWPTTWPHSQRLRYICLALSIVIAFLIRIPYPIGTKFAPLNLQLGFVPQYIFAYTAGHVSAATGNLYCYSYMSNVRHRPIQRLVLYTLKMLWFLFIIAFAAAGIALTSKGVGGGRRSHWKQRAIQNFAGGRNIAAFLYAVLNEVGFVSIGASLVVVFEKYFKQPWTVTLPVIGRRSVGRYCYAMFLVHAVVSVAVELVVENMMGRGCGALREVGAVGMTVMVGLVNVVMSFIVAIAVCEGTWLGRWV